jgi:VanZ family protein
MMAAMPLKFWLPPVLWMGVIMTLSSDLGSAERSEHWLVPLLRLLAPWATPSQLRALHGLVRKAGHVTEYAILATLWYRALVRGRSFAPRPAAAIAFAISLAWAMLDETRQSLVPARTASVVDVAIDGVGALLAMLVAVIGWRTAIDRATTILLWTSLLGGITFLLLNPLSGIPAGLLWLTTPLAAVLLLARTLHTRRHPGPTS